jgi:type IV pilus assembly protein PilC
MVDVGERSGKLDYMFARVAAFYEKSVMNSLQNMTSIVEPVLLISVGLAVGFVGVAVLTPIWKFAETI